MTQPRPKRQSWVEAPPANWAEHEAYRISREIIRLRGKLSAQWLANQTKRIGYEVSRSVISDLENGRRRYVTTAELLVLAAALDTAPVALVYPGPYVDEIEVVPGIHIRKLPATQWFTGELGSGLAQLGHDVSGKGLRSNYRENTEELSLWRELYEVSAKISSITIAEDGSLSPDKLALLDIYSHQVRSIRRRLGLEGAAGDA